MKEQEKPIGQFVAEQNRRKLLFTAGPGSLLAENLTGLRPCFGRGDADYARVEERVLTTLKEMTGHHAIARLQGSATLALEIMVRNFLCGRVLVVATGYYSDRLQALADAARRSGGEITEVRSCPWNALAASTGPFDWIVACYTETSCGLKLPIETLQAVAKRTGARLMLDATASIGLEPGHELADCIAYSSCKGLFGLTGASFVAFNDPPSVEVDSFTLRLQTHLDHLVTGPYHALCSLADVLPRHADFRAAVAENKEAFLRRMKDHLTLPTPHQPQLCTHVDCTIESIDPRAVLYEPRSHCGGSVVCHLGETHLGRAATGEILAALQCRPADPPPLGGPKR